jgi:hypothetical protein
MIMIMMIIIRPLSVMQSSQECTQMRQEAISRSQECVLGRDYG